MVELYYHRTLGVNMEGFVGLILGILFLAIVLGLFLTALLSIAFVMLVALPVSLLAHFLLRHLMRGRGLVVADTLIAAVCGIVGIVLFMQFREPQTWVGLFFLLVCALFVHYADKDNESVRH